MKPLRIALTKGRLEKSTVELLEQIGLDCQSLRDKGRKLILPVGDGSLEAVLAKAADVITYVEHGVCDLGVVGKDTIMENGSRFFEILDLGFGRCSFALAVPKGVDFYQGYRVKTIATKYPGVARRFFESRDMDVRVIKIEGSVELAPLLGQASQEDDATRLLRALRPLLGEARQKKVDEAIKILQLMRLLPLLKESGLFSGLAAGLL